MFQSPPTRFQKIVSSTPQRFEIFSSTWIQKFSRSLADYISGAFFHHKWWPPNGWPHGRYGSLKITGKWWWTSCVLTNWTNQLGQKNLVLCPNIMFSLVMKKIPMKNLPMFRGSESSSSRQLVYPCFSPKSSRFSSLSPAQETSLKPQTHHQIIRSKSPSQWIHVARFFDGESLRCTIE